MGTKRHRSSESVHLIKERRARIEYAQVAARITEIEEKLADIKMHRAFAGSQKHFDRVSRVLDLFLPYDAAEEAIGDLDEVYQKRLLISVPNAKFWLCVQSTWIIYGRIMDLYNRFTRARAGR